MESKNHKIKVDFFGLLYKCSFAFSEDFQTKSVIKYIILKIITKMNKNNS